MENTRVTRRSLLASTTNKQQASIDNEAKLKRRHTSATDVNIDSNDSNSNCSSILSGQQQAATTPVTRQRSQLITNINEQHQPAAATSHHSNKKHKKSMQSPLATFNTPSKQQQQQLDSQQDNQQQCPFFDRCSGDGHLNGKFTTHFILETCPIYFGLSNAKQRRQDLDKSLNDLDEKLTRLNEIQKRATSILTKNLQLPVPTREQNEHAKNIEKMRLMPTKDNKQHDNSQIDFALNDDQQQQEFNTDDLQVPQHDLDLFKDVLQLHADLHEPKKVAINLNTNNKVIQFGEHEIETWYKSPYPDDYWQLPKIYLCEFCLKYMKTSGIMMRHAEKCMWKHPPGKEIYRKNSLSFFEVDGKHNKIFCQNLCLLSKLFLDHKTLYFDVEPFLFYVLTSYNQSKGTFNMIGYFSKEKHSIMNFNLSCILILPQYMKQGYGKLLIDFSYLLSKIEEKIGSPERPLSDLGLISYRNYWKAKLMYYLSDFIVSDEICIKDLSHDTAIHPNDIISTFQFIGLIKYWKGKHVMLKDTDLIAKHLEKWSNNLQVDETCLKWTPYIINKIDTTNHGSSLLNKLSNLSASINA